MKRPRKFFSGIILSLVLASTGLHAQSHAANGLIEGTVRAQNGPALPDVNVGFKNVDNGATRSLRTDKSGRYRAALLPLGNYEIVAEREGYTTIRQTGIALQIGETIVVNFEMNRTLFPETVSLVVKTARIETDRK